MANHGGVIIIMAGLKFKFVSSKPLKNRVGSINNQVRQSLTSGTQVRFSDVLLFKDQNLCISVLLV